MNPEPAFRAARPIRPPIAILLVCAVVTVASLAHVTPAFAQAQDPDLEQKRILAEGYHDLAILYVKKGDLEMAVGAARQIIQLRFPAEYEYKIGQSLSIITEKLAEIRRFDLAQALLDEALKTTEQDANKAKIFKTKARLYMSAGDNEKAIEAWKRALDLEVRRPH